WVDNPEHTDENTRAVVRRELEKYTPHSFIPCITMGGAESTFPGVYDTASDEIAKYNQEKFGVSSNYNHK
ncbi:MAG: uroporphyrinogen decarboxylase, partial [Parasporobacterium sp.]|nr:uroporphyrinogen decarboxylase [Parasporobacterium sp.]